MKKLFTLLFCIFSLWIVAQQASIKAKHPKYVAYIDSLKQLDYNYIFPFWNIYGILGYTWSETRVVLASPVSFETKAQLQGPTYGIGTNLAAGVGPVWVSGDANLVFAELDKLDKPVPAINTSFRVGHTFVDYDKPYRNVAIWAGVFGSFIENRTVGAIDLREVIPPGSVGEEIKGSDWYNGLGPARKAIVDEILDAGAESDLVINYDLAKAPKAPWNMIIGFQNQCNKNWQLRAEAGMFGERSQFLASLNYRFRT
jgi:hypothetical protein